MTEILALTAAMPAHRLAPGEVLFERGDSGTSIAVLEGQLLIELDGMRISEVAAPGAVVGEIGALLGSPRTATVVAGTETAVRLVGDADTLFVEHPEVALEIARQLASRLERLLVYLGDLREQYADSDGHLAVFDAVLGRIASRPPVTIEPGSDRSPDY
jgi:CRP/FNR family transcriptional regulator, cyclic AMP receptor protein